MACPAFTATVFGRSKPFAFGMISEHTLGTFSCSFSRIPEDTLGSFSAPFRGVSGLHGQHRAKIGQHRPYMLHRLPMSALTNALRASQSDYSSIYIYGGARRSRRPSNAGPRKQQKSFRFLAGSFLDRIPVAHTCLQEHSPAAPRFEGTQNRKKTPFWHICLTIFSFLWTTKCCKLPLFFDAFCGNTAKNPKHALNTTTFWLRDAQNTANTSGFC